MTHSSALAPQLSSPPPRGGLRRAQIARRSRFKLEKLAHPCRKYRRGAATVEFALLLPVLFLMVFGMIEYGRLVMVQQVMASAAREGARAASLQPQNEDTIREIVEQYCQGARVAVQQGDVAVDYNPENV